MQARHACLIKLKYDSEAVTRVISGQPMIRPMDWGADSFNLVGFWADQDSPPSFQSIFATSPLHAGTELEVKRIKVAYSEPDWQPVSNLAAANIQHGEAYLFSKKDSL